MENNKTGTESRKNEVLRMSNLESNRFTKECIQTALLSLMSDETFDKITATAIIKRSGVSRAGFYRNYSSKEEVLDEMTDEFLNVLSDFIADSRYQSAPYLWYYDLFQTIADNADIVRLLLKARVPHQFLFKTEKWAKELQINQTPKERYRSTAIVKSITEVATDWFEHGMEETPEEMAEFFVELFHQA